jgi:hypothetical protein
MNKNMKYQKENIELRRARVAELDSHCCSQRDIADKLGCSIGLVNGDLKYIRNRAKDKIRELIDKRLPEEYNRTLAGLDSILRESWAIKENATDNRERMQALSLAKECYNSRLEMLTNPDLVEDIVRLANKGKEPGLVSQDTKPEEEGQEQEQEEQQEQEHADSK